MIKNQNSPSLWRATLPWPPKPDGNKYDRGHVMMVGGPVMTGAIRMASRASMRIGAGLCTIAAPLKAMGIYQADAPHIMFEPTESLSVFAETMQDKRRNAVLIGPGLGQDKPAVARKAILDILALKRFTVLDADALNLFEGKADQLCAALHDRCVLTPHEGEFKKLFPEIKGDRIAKARAAAGRSPAVILLKGQETILAQGERLVRNDHATPWLATAGAGDVLAGMITGLGAQELSAFDASCAGAWMHGEAGLRCGPGLIAPDIIEMLPRVMRDFA
jgi:hydroxyethylthiazole kinase-like uncharacterized protein yjeF